MCWKSPRNRYSAAGAASPLFLFLSRRLTRDDLKQALQIKNQPPAPLSFLIQMFLTRLSKSRISRHRSFSYNLSDLPLIIFFHN
jgi:hypothetical protein